MNSSGSLLIYFSLPLFFACSTAPEKENASGISENSRPDSARLATNYQSLLESNQKSIDNDLEFNSSGLKFARLGGSISGIDKLPRGITARDTVFAETNSAGDWKWPAKVLDYEDGRVYIEGDPNGNPDIVFRIRLESVKFKNANGIGTGSTVKDLYYTYPDFHISPYPEMKLVEISLPDIPEIIFHVSDPEGKFSNGGGTIGITSLPPDAKVIRVVIWNPGISLS